jgi:hypothetical protein
LGHDGVDRLLDGLLIADIGDDSERAVSFNLSAFMSSSATCTPSELSRCATAKPSPSAPPVMTAARSFHWDVVVVWFMGFVSFS